MTTKSKPMVIAALGLAGLAGLAGLVSEAPASEVTYDEIAGGTATIVASDLTNPSVTISLSGNVFNLTTGPASAVGFDALGLTLDSFVFASTGGTVTVSSPSIYAGTTIDFTSLSLQSSGASPVTSLGGGDYQITGAAATASGMFSVNGGTAKSVTSAPTTGLSGTIGISGTPDTLGVDGITLGTMSVGGQTISLMADIAFEGTAAVPLPAGAWLFGSGLGLLGVPFLRRRVEREG